VHTGFWWGDLNEKVTCKHRREWEKDINKMEGRELDSSGSGCGQITASFEHDSNTLGSLKC